MKKTMAFLLALALTLTACMSIAVADENVNDHEKKTGPAYYNGILLPGPQPDPHNDDPHRRPYPYTWQHATPDGKAVVWGWWNPYYYWRTPTVPAQEKKAEQPAYGRGTLAGVTWSTEILKQVWLNGRSLQLRVYVDGVQDTFTEYVEMSDDGSLRLVLVARAFSGDAKPVLDMKAVQRLMAAKIVGLSIIGPNGTTNYSIDELKVLAGDNG